MSITDELRKWAEDNTLRDRELTTYPPQHVVHGVLETLLRIADRIDAEALSRRNEAYNMGYNAGIDMGFSSADDWLADHEDAMAEHGWVKLPVDADGVPIRVGDVMENVVNPSIHRRVAGVGAECFYAWEDGFGRYSQFDALNYRHHHEPTVEQGCAMAGIQTQLEV